MGLFAHSEYRGQDVPIRLRHYYTMICDSSEEPGCSFSPGISDEFKQILINASEKGNNGWSIRRAFVKFCKDKGYKNYLILRNYSYDIELQGRVYELWVDKDECNKKF